jgi:HemY protein
MPRFIVFLLVLIASVWIGLKVVTHPGYVLFAYQPWLVEMPLWFATLALVVAFFLFYCVIDSLHGLQGTWQRLQYYWRLRRLRQSYEQAQSGVSALIEARFDRAEQLFMASAKQVGQPLMHYLGAAKAAHAQGAFERRDTYLQKAYQVKQAEMVVGLVQAQLQLEHDQWEQATATLIRLQQMAPRHPRVLALLERVYVRQADWSSLHALLPYLRQEHILDATQLELFEKNLYSEQLKVMTNETVEAVRSYWQGLPRRMKKHPTVIAAYVKQLSRFPGTEKERETLIRTALQRDWHACLVRWYGALSLPDLNRQLAVVGAWQKQYGSQPELLFVLGQLCVRAQLWGKAKTYFSQCMTDSGLKAEAALAYGQLLEQLGQQEQALQVYREGLTPLNDRHGS